MKSASATFNPTPEMIDAAKAVFLSMAYVETVREVIEPIQNRLLQENHYKMDINRFTRSEGDAEQFTALHGIYCRKWSELYLIFDEDMTDLMIKANYEYQKAGFKIELNYCPLLVAESTEREAKRLLIDIMQPVTGMTTDNVLCSKNGLENYKKLVELTLRLLAPFCK